MMPEWEGLLLVEIMYERRRVNAWYGLERFAAKGHR